MKVTIPIDSGLCTDSHEHEIKDPSTGRDLFSRNRAYLYNRHLTNPRKTTVSEGNYITTSGDLLEVTEGSEKTQITHNGKVIADVLSLGVEDTQYLDKDDAVIDQGSMWTVEKTITGYILEQTNLETQEVTTTPVMQDGVIDVRFVRNTHKVITRNYDGTITIDGTVYSDDVMAQYLVSYTGEFTAVEINGKIHFGYNNPAGVAMEKPTNNLDLAITANTFGWNLADKIPDQNIGYIITINISNNVQIGGVINGYALDLLTGVKNPILHEIIINMGVNSVISGKGGNGGNGYSPTNYSNGQSGFTAINCGSRLIVNGQFGTIQGGGGGGGGCGGYYSLIGDRYYGTAGGGGAGNPPGSAGKSTNPPAGNITNAKAGTVSAGGIGGTIQYGGRNLNAGSGGSIGKSGGNATGGFGNNNVSANGLGGKNGAAIRLLKPALITVNNTTIIGGIIEV